MKLCGYVFRILVDNKTYVINLLVFLIYPRLLIIYIVCEPCPSVESDLLISKTNSLWSWLKYLQSLDIWANSSTHPWLTRKKKIKTLVWRLMEGLTRNWLWAMVEVEELKKSSCECTLLWIIHDCSFVVTWSCRPLRASHRSTR